MKHISKKKNRQATDFIKSKNAYRLYRTEEEPGNHVFYYLQNEPDKTFVCEELMHIPRYTLVLPKLVSKWK